MNRNTIALSGALALLLAAGCGNKGPLYLPQQDTGASDTTVIDQASGSGPGGEASE
jgi:predicted small lipoprotein YifL